MRFFVLFLVACSADATSPKDASTEDASVADAVIDAVSDAVVSQGTCAACTANMCLASLQACGASQPCVNALVSFNDCLAAHGPQCGTSFASTGATAGALWSCLSTKCSAVCGTE